MKAEYANLALEFRSVRWTHKMENHESPELNPLQIFLLVLVGFGLATSYDLLSKAGLGTGLTSPALKRLQKAGLLTSTPGPRNRLRYAITEKGAKQLRESVKPGELKYWQLGQMDVYESLPRGIILAWLHSGADAAREGAIRAGGNLVTMARRKEREAKELRGTMNRLQADIVKNDPAADEGMLVATAYQWIKALCETELFLGQSHAIGVILNSIADLPPAQLVQRGNEGVW